MKDKDKEKAEPEQAREPKNFQKLTPDHDLDIGIYADAFSHVFREDNSDIRNIAVTGPFSSGKSSITYSYLEKHEQGKYVTISLSNFNRPKKAAEDNTSQTEGDNQGNNKEKLTETEPDENTLEKRIVNHLVQLMSDKELKDTAYQRPAAERTISIETLEIFVLIFCSIFLCHYPYNIGSIFTGWIATVLTALTGQVAFIIATLLLLLDTIKLIHDGIRWLRNRHGIRKISVNGNSADVQDPIEKRPYFDLNLDDILDLILRAENYKIFVFEDLDRFEKADLTLLNQLRELNNLVNQRKEHSDLYRCSKHFHRCKDCKNTNKKGEVEPIRFFYLLRDDYFKSTDRTKFFDYIIPIVPVLEGSNAYSKLTECLQQEGVEQGLSSIFLRNISLYISDYRLMKNIVNEYQIYLDRLGNTLPDKEQLFAMTVYKNVYPEDYAKLQRQEGYVYKVFQQKNTLLVAKEKDLKQQIDDLSTRIEKSKDELLTNKSELEAVKNDRFNNRNSRNKYKDINYEEWVQSYYALRSKAIDDKSSKKQKELQEQLQEVQGALKEVQNNMLYELADDQQVDPFQLDNESDEIPENPELIQFLIRNGYINELTYKDYLTYFYDGDLTPHDKIFLDHVNLRSPMKMDDRLDKPEIVLEYLSADIFKNQVCLNLSLIHYLFYKQKSIENRYGSEGWKARIQNFTMLLSDLSQDDRMKFIELYFNDDPNSTARDFTKGIVSFRPQLLASVIQDEGFLDSSIKQEFTLFALLECSHEILASDEMKEMVSQYLSEEAKNISCDASDRIRLANLIHTIHVNFKDLEHQVIDRELRQKVYQNNDYQINIENITYILAEYYQLPAYQKRVIQPQILSDLWLREDQELSDRFQDDPAEILQFVLDVVQKNHIKLIDKEDTIIGIVNSDGVVQDLALKYLQRVETEISVLSDLQNKEYSKVLLDKDMVKADVDNILYYGINIGVDSYLCKFMNKHEDIDYDLAIASEEEKKTFWNKCVSVNQIQDKIYISLAEQFAKGTLLTNFRIQGLSEIKIRELISLKLIPMNSGNLTFIRTNYQDEVAQFAASSFVNYFNLIGQPIRNDSIKQEFLRLLEDTHYITGDMKLKMLAKHGEVGVSLQSCKIQDDKVNAEILTNHYVKEDLEYLLTHYSKYGPETKKRILEKAKVNINFCGENVVQLDDELLLEILRTNSYTILLPFTLKHVDELAPRMDEILEACGGRDFQYLFKSHPRKTKTISDNPRNEQLAVYLKNAVLIQSYEKDSENGTLIIHKN